MGCYSQFSVYRGGKNDVVQHSKSKQDLEKVLSFSIDHQLIILIDNMIEKDVLYVTKTDSRKTFPDVEKKKIPGFSGFSTFTSDISVYITSRRIKSNLRVHY